MKTQNIKQTKQNKNKKKKKKKDKVGMSSATVYFGIIVHSANWGGWVVRRCCVSYVTGASN